VQFTPKVDAPPFFFSGLRPPLFEKPLPLRELQWFYFPFLRQMQQLLPCFFESAVGQIPRSSLPLRKIVASLRAAPFFPHLVLLPLPPPPK